VASNLFHLHEKLRALGQTTRGEKLSKHDFRKYYRPVLQSHLNIFGPHVSPAEVRVYFLRLQLTMLKGTSLKETYRELGLGQYMSLDRFNFISANAEKLCEVIRHRSLDCDFITAP